MNITSYTGYETILRAAAVAHEVNRVYCEMLGDFSQPHWADIEDWQFSSAIEGVKAVALNPEITPAQSHENWMAYKLEDGWVYGPEKDPEAKTHPCMVPYDDLPETQKTKDKFFTAAVRAALGLSDKTREE